MSKMISVEYRVALAKKNLSLKDVAKIINISPAYVSDLLTGKRNGEKAKDKLKQIDDLLEIEKVKETK